MGIGAILVVIGIVLALTGPRVVLGLVLRLPPGPGTRRGFAARSRHPGAQRLAFGMSPQRRTALASIAAAALLAALKLGAGLASGSLGLVSEALHSGTDLVAALLTFFAVGVAGRPADRGTRTATARPSTSPRSRRRRCSPSSASPSPALAVDAAHRRDRARDRDCLVGLRGARRRARDRRLAHRRVAAPARRYDSAALLSNALHFGSDLAGTLAVLGGLVAAAPGYPRGRLDRRALRRGARAPRRRPADPAQRRRADGPRAGGGRGRRRARRSRVSTRRSQLSRLRLRQAGAHVRRRRHLRLAGRRRRPGPRCRPTGSRRRSSAPCPAATSSSTSSRARPRRPCASARTPPRSRPAACARSTTSASSRSTAPPSSRCT